MKKFKYISNLTLDEIENNIVIPCIDENGNHSIIIKNATTKIVSNKYITDNLLVQIDTQLFIDNDVYYCHIISANKKDMYSLGQFYIIYEYIFKKIEEPIGGSNLSALITSLEDYFKITPDPNLFSLQVGVFGELITIKYLYDSGYHNIINKFHNNFYSKHDVELDDKNRIEIKTTVSEKRIHRFKHNQIYRKDVNVYIASVMLEESKEGLSLYELFQKVLELYSDADNIFGLNKLMKRCNVNEENKGLTISFEKALNDFRIFDANTLPKINIDIPDGVSNVTYDVDCSLSEYINIDTFAKMLHFYF